MRTTSSLFVRSQAPLPRWALAATMLGVFVTATAVYALLPTRAYTFDSLAYAHQIRESVRTGRPGWLFHPHHLLFNPLGWLAWRGQQAVTAQDDPLQALQALNAVCGGLGLSLICGMVASGGRRATHFADLVLGTTAAAWLGVTFGYWTCATDGRVNMPSLVAVLATLGALLRVGDRPTPRNLNVAAALTVTAVLLHQSHGMLLIPASVAILGSGLAPDARRAALIRYFGLTLGGIAVIYLAIAVGVRGVRSFQDFRMWSLAYAQDGRWWNTDLMQGLVADGRALERAFLSGLPSASEPAAPGAAIRLRPILTFIPFAMIGAVLARRGLDHALDIVPRPQVRRSKRRSAVLLAAGGLYATFFTFWNPGYFVFWLPVATLLILGAGLGIRASRLPIRIGGAYLMLTAGLLYGYANLNTTLLARTQDNNNRLLRICRELRDLTGKGDVLLVRGEGGLATLETYATYFTSLSVVASNNLLSHNPASIARSRKDLRLAMEKQRTYGGRVLALAEVVQGPDWPTLRELPDVPWAYARPRRLAYIEGIPLFVLAENGAPIEVRGR